ncbi:MAG: excinuclease ABC subunit UvrC [Chloroflexota bacterium]
MPSVQVRERLRALPSEPGVYLFKDARGRIIYIGKAAQLRSRVGSYFGSRSGFSTKLLRLVEQVADFEFYVTSSEEEALVLELNLIKRFRPRYNISLKDDKSFPYLKIDLADDFPRAIITRRVRQDGARYFGPFASAHSVRTTMHLIRKIFPFRSCAKPLTGRESRACLDYHIRRCLGPCIGAVTKEEYAALVRQVILFLEGRQGAVLRELHRQMGLASSRLEYEKAALLRDQVRAVERVIEGQRLATTAKGTQDVVAFTHAGDACVAQVFFIRNDKVTGRECFTLEGTGDEMPDKIMSSFIEQFYSKATTVPPLLLLQHPVEDTRVVQQWLSKKRGGPVRLVVPHRGNRKRLVDMVAENARQEMEQRKARGLAAPEDMLRALTLLAEALHLPRPPQRIECYDISDVAGTSAVGSMVTFEEGMPKRPHYRRFRIKTVEGADDYAMMREVLRRRFRRGPAATVPSGPWAITPDLVLIDGGKGHLNAAIESMKEVGAGSIPVASIAKEYEEVFLPGLSGPIVLPDNSPALYLLQRIRDEAHRFALSYHQRLRGRASRASLLDTIPGVGPKRRRALLKRFGSIRAATEASLDDLASVPGMTRAIAERVKQYLHGYEV